MASTLNLLADRAAQIFPGGVNSNVRLDTASRFFERGHGSRIWDTDGKEYIDYLLGQGPAFLGHSFPPVRDAVNEALGKGIVFGAQTPTETAAGEAVLSAINWADSVRFSMTGTEAVQAGLRVARAHTGRNTFIRFRGHYHGWLDNVLTDPTTLPPGMPSDGQNPHAFDDSVTLEWNDGASLRAALEARPDAYAAVIMEPMMLNAGAVTPAAGYLEEVRELCTRFGVVLIFDETITGFRLALGGAAELFGVTPDLAIYGKAMAGGYPAAALAGRAEIMARFARGTNHSGTFNANLPACAAVFSAITYMRQNNVHETVRSTGLALQAGLSRVFEARGLPIGIRGVGSAFHLAFGGPPEVKNYSDLALQDSAAYRALLPRLHDAGVWVAARGIWYVSDAHTPDDVEETLARVESAIID